MDLIPGASTGYPSRSSLDKLVATHSTTGFYVWMIVNANACSCMMVGLWLTQPVRLRNAGFLQLYVVLKPDRCRLTFPNDLGILHRLGNFAFPIIWSFTTWIIVQFPLCKSLNQIFVDILQADRSRYHIYHIFIQWLLGTNTTFMDKNINYQLHRMTFRPTTLQHVRLISIGLTTCCTIEELQIYTLCH